MGVNQKLYQDILNELKDKVVLVAVSKVQSIEDIRTLYELGQRDFGENYVQELVAKYEALPKDIRWHFIGHLQSNKVKYIAPFVHLIHGIDSEDLLKEMNKQALKNKRKINCLLQVHIAQEETKFGFDIEELNLVVEKIKKENSYPDLNICGLMGMASFSDDEQIVKSEMAQLHQLFIQIKEALDPYSTNFNILSMGMSGDYKIALQEGSNMVRIGSLLFGARLYNK